MNTKISHVENLVKTGEMPVNFITCKDPKGRDCHYFLVCSDADLKKIQRISEGVFDINDYAKIVAAGWGKTPSAATIDRLNRTYGLEIKESDFFN